ncbi:ABC transporter substrate-binding protein, partial [Salmonella enterica]|uniref:ABC transporter substrate-binding protein n=1 Tax=Salmonella enterica TaxID=28901 RepID=UPI00329A2064
KARAILDEAGWKIYRAGVREKAGKEARLTFWYASGDSTRRDLAVAVRDMLQPLGIVVSLQSGSWETVVLH